VIVIVIVIVIDNMIVVVGKESGVVGRAFGGSSN